VGNRKAVTYAFPPGYRENAEEEEDLKIPQNEEIIIKPLFYYPPRTGSMSW
jgi:hypothetical protein